MIRLVLVSLYVLLFLILSSPSMLVTWIIGKINKNAGNRASLWIVNHIGFRVVQFLAGVKVKVIGHERIPDGPVLYINNHRGFFDTIVSYQLVKNPTGYVAKKEILYAPLLNIWMLLLNCQFLDRKRPRSGMDMLLKSIDLVKSGVSICIFPEGTRNRDAESDELLPFHAGSFKIATKTGCPIVPVTIINAGKVWEDHFPWMHGKNMVIEYGEPIMTGELSKEDQKNISEITRDIIQKTYIKNKADYADFLNAR